MREHHPNKNMDWHVESNLLYGIVGCSDVNAMTHWLSKIFGMYQVKQGYALNVQHVSWLKPRHPEQRIPVTQVIWDPVIWHVADWRRLLLHWPQQIPCEHLGLPFSWIQHIPGLLSPPGLWQAWAFEPASFRIETPEIFDHDLREPWKQSFDSLFKHHTHHEKQL